MGRVKTPSAEWRDDFWCIIFRDGPKEDPLRGLFLRGIRHSGVSLMLELYDKGLTPADAASDFIGLIVMIVTMPKPVVWLARHA